MSDIYGRCGQCGGPLTTGHICANPSIPVGLIQLAPMTLREAAAIAAMQGFIARDVAQQFSAFIYAQYAREAADALLAALAAKDRP